MWAMFSIVNKKLLEGISKHFFLLFRIVSLGTITLAKQNKQDITRQHSSFSHKNCFEFPPKDVGKGICAI